MKSIINLKGNKKHGFNTGFISSVSPEDLEYLWFEGIWSEGAPVGLHYHYKLAKWSGGLVKEHLTLGRKMYYLT